MLSQRVERAPFIASSLPVLTILAVQAAMVSWTFPALQLLTETPLFNIDGAFHWYQIEVARALAAQGQLVGYDPHFAAGHIGGVTLNGSAKLPALVAVCLGDMASSAVAYKLTVFAMAIIAPAMVPIAGFALHLRVPSTWICAALSLCLWWASGFRWWQTAGMTGFVFASFLSLPYTALLLQAVTRPPRIGTVCLLGLFGAFGLFVHPLFPVIVALSLPAFLLVYRKEINYRAALVALVGIAVLSALPNLPWAFAIVGSHVGAFLESQPYQRAISFAALLKQLAGIWGSDTMGAKLFVGLLAASAYGAVFSTDAYVKRLACASILAWLTIVLFAHLGAAIPGIGSVQPNRFSSVAYLFLVPATAAVISSLLSEMSGSFGLRQLAAVAASLVIALSVGWATFEVSRELSYRPIGHYGAIPPEVRPVGEKTAWVSNWLLRKTSREGRVLFETSKGRILDNSNNAGFLALSTDREFIGGPYPFMFMAGAWDGVIFGRPIEGLDEATFSSYLELYNVGWIVAHSPELKNYLAAARGIVIDEQHGEIFTYRVERALSYFVRGAGTVASRGINRLELTGMSGDEVVIKYHYIRGLQAEPPTRIEPTFLPGVGDPFIRLVSPPQGKIRLFVK